MLKRIIDKIIRVAIGRISPEKFVELTYRHINSKCASTEINRAMKMLFELDNMLYGLQGRTAIKNNDGVHPKHKILQYKEWFLEKIDPEWTVLDVGCNTGMMPEVMSNKAAFVYGIEIVARHIEEAKAKHQKDNIEFVCADATSYDYSNWRGIDCVTLSNVLEHIEHRVEFLTKLIKQIKWSNESQKAILIRVPVIDRDWRAVYKKEIGCEYRLDSTHFTEYTTEEFREEMNSANIEVVSLERKFGEIYAVCRAI